MLKRRKMIAPQDQPPLAASAIGINHPLNTRKANVWISFNHRSIKSHYIGVSGSSILGNGSDPSTLDVN
jgi:hypothetical protein